mmetsp:Transcript_43502/g.41963  ORF Transcript_43502/g.41963 Transcript_43502/m.41963 type:complete len:123 (+) Transcript_43502:425-793(+)
MSLLKNLHVPKADLTKPKDGEVSKNAASRKATIDENFSSKIEEAINEEEEVKKQTEVEVEEVKKKKKRNVETKDAQTQTYRSDYMLIKLRQQQKIALNKGQKNFKDDMLVYDSQKYKLMNQT